jgi:hypothetical protein
MCLEKVWKWLTYSPVTLIPSTLARLQQNIRGTVSLIPVEKNANLLFSKTKHRFLIITCSDKSESSLRFFFFLAAFLLFSALRFLPEVEPI